MQHATQTDSMGDGPTSRLRERFGLREFRPWQREAVDTILNGSGRTLVVAPTGGGKSLCYQFPATELPGTTIVVSPLIALMEDQVRGLRERGVAATWLSSTVGLSELRNREAALREGKYDLVYVAPERLKGGRLLDVLGRLQPPLVAVDEAHCISQWGHDFRPDYLRLGEVLRQWKPPRLLACTATATPRVRDEILRQLGLDGPETKVILRGFARPNLHLAVEEVESSSRRKNVVLGTLRDAIGRPAAPAGGVIVYASTRKQTERLAEVIARDGWKVAAYHAGMEAGERAEVNGRFASGELSVVVATNAFGMGIDRPDIRAVIHANAPGSIEAYYQEVGRAGRDGQPAYGLLLSAFSDMGLRRRLIDLRRDDDDATEEAERQWALFLDLMKYVEAGSCRHDFILRYFGDEEELLGGCGHCDVCERLEELGVGELVVTDEDAALVRMALSAVARAKRRAGMAAVAEMLQGASTDKLKRLGFTDLSTFGLMAGREKDWILALLRRLVAAGLLGITSGKYPMPYLTTRGRDVMVSRDPVRVLPPPPDAGKPRHRRKGRRPAKAELPKNADPKLFEALRAERTTIARERGVPPYVVCHDRTLSEIAALRPTTMAELGNVHGMGPARLSEYGARLLTIVATA